MNTACIGSRAQAIQGSEGQPLIVTSSIAM